MFVVSYFNGSEGDWYEGQGYEHEEFENFEDGWERFQELIVEDDREAGCTYTEQDYEEIFRSYHQEFEQNGHCGDGEIDLSDGYLEEDGNDDWEDV